MVLHTCVCLVVCALVDGVLFDDVGINLRTSSIRGGQ